MEAQTFLKLLLSVLFFILIPGNCEKCDLSSIQIQQTNLGKDPINGVDTVFEVEVRNLCSCNLKSVFVNTRGFASSVMVDPKVFRQQSNSYLVNDGQAIPCHSAVKFRYSWDHYFRMSPASIQPEC
ncbi:TPD1 protein homolog 1-like [Carex rostrata]